MNGFEKRREEKKAAILKAAEVVFFKKGFKDASIEEIAGEAKVSPASVYNFFDTKMNLYIKTIEKAFYNAMDKYDEILNSDQSFHEKLLAFIKYRIDSRNGLNPDYFKQEDLKNPELAKIVAEVTRVRIIPFFLQLVQQGKAEGAIDNDIDAEAVILYINIFASGLMNANLQQKISGNERLSAGVGKLFLFGFAGNNENDTGNYTI